VINLIKCINSQIFAKNIMKKIKLSYFKIQNIKKEIQTFTAIAIAKEKMVRIR
jgi:hypothetical protein